MRKSYKGQVKKMIMEKIAENHAIHMVLIDPDITPPDRAAKIAVEAEKAGSSAVMVGGSIGVSERMVDETVIAIKENSDLPVILFPGSIGELSKYADAVWFLSVLNSVNPYFIIGGQMQAAPIIKRYGVEPLSLAYLILGCGGAVSYVSNTRPIPFDQAEVVVAFALAAQFLGFQFIYLEGGSGGKPIPPNIIKMVSETVTIPLIVGGGIRNGELAKRAVEAGANIIVTGTIIEEVSEVYKTLKEIVDSIKEAAKKRRGRDAPLLQE